MASNKRIIPFIRKWEGEYAEIPGDAGGATKWGVTLGTFRMAYGASKTKADLKAMTEGQWAIIFTRFFWDKIAGDRLTNQRSAEMLCDWVWHSGVTAIKHCQRITGVKADGQVGPKTVEAFNRCNDETLYNHLRGARLEFLDSIVARNPIQAKFLKGWRNRVYDLDKIR